MALEIKPKILRTLVQDKLYEYEVLTDVITV